MLKPEAAKANTKIPEETLLAAYQERIDEFKRPERRNVDQLLFINQADADKAYANLQSGTSFDEVAKNSPIMNKGATSLGKIEREHIIEDAAAAVFTATKKSVTKPVKSPFGWHIFHVRDIDPPSAAPLSEVRATLEKEIKQQVLDDAFNKLLNQIEDALAGGTPLQEAAKEFGIAVSTIGPITREGKTPDGSMAKLPPLDRFLEVAFKTEDKMESPLINSNGGAYYIVRVDTLQPQRQRSLDEVRGLVTTAWQKEERAQRLQQMATEMAAKMADKAARADAINHYNLNTLYTGRLKRTQTQAGETPLPPAMVSDIFARPAGASTEAYPLSSGQYAIAVAGERIPAGPMKPEDAREIREELEANLKREIGGEYLAYLERKYPVTINDALIQSLRDQQ